MTRRRRNAKSMAAAAARARGDSHAARDGGTAEPPRKPLKVADGYQGKAAAVPLFRVGVTYFEAFAPPRWPTQILGVATGVSRRHYSTTALFPAAALLGMLQQ